jgi:hypothetical protein
MELALYNGVLSGISLSGDSFFYENHLASAEGETRRPWIGIACCPTNLARIIPQIGGLVYSENEDRIYVNLYAAGEAQLTRADGAAVKLTQQTDYPWNGRVRLKLELDDDLEFDLCLRIPGWALGHPVPGELYRFADAETSSVGLMLNGQSMEAVPGEDGYVHLQRRWQTGDVVELDLPMPIRRVHAHEKVEEDRGKVALMRGPVVYCLEAVDHSGVDIFSLAVKADAQLHEQHYPELLGGVTVIQGEARADDRLIPITAIPYYAWANRDQGAMTVWIGEDSG